MIRSHRVDSSAMKLKHLFLIGLLAGGTSACHKKATTGKSAEQARADQKAIAVRAVADQKITAQNDAATLKTTVLKQNAVKKTTVTSTPLPAVSPTVVPVSKIRPMQQ